MGDTYRQIAVDAIERLFDEELVTEQEFGIGSPTENFNEASEKLRERLAAVDEIPLPPRVPVRGSRK